MFDLFGVKVGFRINNKETYGSSLGGCIFIIYAILASMFLAVSLKVFIGMETFNLLSIEKNFSPAKRLNLSEHEFAFAMRVSFNNGTSLEGTPLEDFFYVKANVIRKTGKEKSKTEILSHPCTQNDFYHLANSSVFQATPMNEFSCFANKTELELDGTFTEYNYTYIEYDVGINNKYFSDYQKVIEAFTKYQFRLSMYYSNPLYDVSDREKPIFFELASYYTFLDLSVFKRNNIDFQEFVFEDDQNLLMDDYKKKTFMKLQSTRQLFVSVQDRANSPLPIADLLVKYYIRAVNVQHTIKRSYKKITNFMAEVMALLFNCLIGMGFLILLMNTFKARQSIMKRVMKYTDDLGENDETKKELDEIKKSFKKVGGDKEKAPETKDDAILHVGEGDEKEGLTTGNTAPNPAKKNTYTIGCCDIFAILFCCGGKEKKEVYADAQKKLFYNLDMVTYMKKMQEIDMMKYMLLDNDSLKIMNFISKPGVSYTKKNEKTDPFFNEDLNFQDKPDYIKELKCIQESYGNLKKKANATEGEKKIIELFEVQVDEILKEM